MKTRTKNWLGMIAIILVIILGILSGACTNIYRKPFVIISKSIIITNDTMYYFYGCVDNRGTNLYFDDFNNYNIGDTIK